MLNNQVKFNVAIISNVHIYQFFSFFWGGEGWLLVKLTVPFILFFSLGGGVGSKGVKS